MSFYYADAEKQIINEALLDSEAIAKAESFKKGDFNSRPRRPPLTQTQLRRFFDDVNQLEKKYETQWRELEREGVPEKEAKLKVFPRIRPHVKMLKSKVAYAFEKIPPSFENFMNETIDEIKDARDFEAFLAYFEAVVGFSKKELKKH